MRVRAIILVFFSVSFSVLVTYGQKISINPFYDALKLKELNCLNDKGIVLMPDALSGDSLKNETNIIILKILAAYMDQQDPTPAEILRVYNGTSDGTGRNPFIHIDDENILTGRIQNFSGIKAESLASIKQGISGIGGLDVTTLADGLAKFLVSRTKEELNVAFFSHLKEVLDDKRYRDFRVLFPSTYQLLDAIGDEIYNYNRYLINLREAFKTDLNELDANFPDIIDNHKQYFHDYFEYAVALNSSSFISSSLRDEIHPGQIIATYPIDEFLKKEGESVYFDANVSGAVQTLQLFSESLRDTSQINPKYWVSYEQVRKLMNDEVAFKIYLGLIYQQAVTEYGGINFKTGSLIAALDTLSEREDWYPKYKNYILELSRKTDALNQLISKYEKPQSDSVSIEAYALYVKSTIELVDHIADVAKLPYLDNLLKYNDTEFRKYLSVGEFATDIAIDVNRKNYASAINNSIVVYNLLLTQPLTESAKVEKVDSVKRSLESSRDSSKAFVSKLAKYGSFMASVSSAKTSDEVQVAIEAAALPSGSSRIKRESAFNVSLNAYLGFYAGREEILGKFQRWPAFNSYGLSAPVGISMSIGNRQFYGIGKDNSYQHWSHTLFISVLDIGSVAAFRFANDSIASVPNIQLQDIVSPGLFYSIGIPKTPLSINLGAQIGPNLRKVYIEDKENPGEYINSYQDNIYIRYSASLVVDIPIFNFYTKSERRIR